MFFMLYLQTEKKAENFTIGTLKHDRHLCLTWTEHDSKPDEPQDELSTKAVAQPILHSWNQPSQHVAARTQRSPTNVDLPSSSSVFCKLKQWNIKQL